MRVLFLNLLADDLAIIERLDKEVHGEPYAELFRKGMGLKRHEFISVNAALEGLPRPEEFDGIVIGGSIYNPVIGEERPWMSRVYKFICKTIFRRIPLLGVCGGHQFIARALGWEVVYNPEGREFGTKEVWLTEEGKRDIFFDGLPERFKVQLSHQCIVAKNLRGNWPILASSDMCNIQALAPSFHTRTVQFHLELGVSQMKKIATMRKDIFIGEGFVRHEDEFQELMLSIEETPYGAKILRNFVKHFIVPRTSRC